MKGRLAWIFLLATTGGVPAQSPAPSSWFDLPLAGGTRTLAALGIEPSLRADTLPHVARMLHGQDSRPLLSADRLSALLRETSSAPPGEEDGVQPVDIPAPLTRQAWQQLLDLKTGEDLSVRLLTDRAATLVAAGLVETDASVRSLLARDRDLLRKIYRGSPGAFAIAARSLRLNGGRVGVPGGPGADRIWEALAGTSPGRPAAFLAALLSRDGGRLAWYFDTLSTLDTARVQLAWPDADAGTRLDNARALYEAFRNIDARVRLEDYPFRRGAGDPWMVLALTDLRDGVLTGPSWPWFWDALFHRSALDREQAERLDRSGGGAVTLTWLTSAIGSALLRERKDRFEMFRLAQRVFPTPRDADASDLAVALGGYRRYRGVLLTLERMRIATPSTWAALVEAAREVDRSDDRIPAVTAFQGAIALVTRMWHVGTCDTAAAEWLLLELSRAVRADRDRLKGVRLWIKGVFAPPYDAALLEALAGPAPRAPQRIEWEGLTYTVDFAAAERDRLSGMRGVLVASPLDAAIDAGDGAALADAIASLVYAVAMGDPDGPASLSRDIAERHDFALNTTRLTEEVWSWAPPVERQLQGRPWHVMGSLLGLDLALARLSIRRIASDEMPNAPLLSLNDFATLARTVVAMVPSELSDADRDELAGAIARGRQRLADATADADRLVALAREADVSASVREMLPWMAQHEPGAIPSFFSLRDLLWLGNPAVPAERLDRWGVLASGLDNRQTPAMPRASAWENFAGRADLGQMATQIPDLTLRLAEETARLRLPATLVPALLTFAVEDYWHDVRAGFSDDWPAMVRQAAALDSQRIQDYVAALAGVGPLRLR